MSSDSPARRIPKRRRTSITKSVLQLPDLNSPPAEGPGVGGSPSGNMPFSHSQASSSMPPSADGAHIAETMYKERCIVVNNGDSWAKYMFISGSVEDEQDIITLQYTEEGLLTIDENRDGHTAAFGDDIAIECLATEFKREVYVVQAHGADAMVDEENCVFFLPHRLRGEICEPPIFLFMKGTAWCSADADHYEPLIATVLQHVTPDKEAVVL